MGVERSGVSFWMSLRAVGDGAGILLVVSVSLGFLI